MARYPFQCAVILTLFVAVLLGACQPEGRSFQATLTEGYALPVTLVDTTGLVTGIAQPSVDPAVDTLQSSVLLADPNDPNAMVLAWSGEACDGVATVWFQWLSGGYSLGVSTNYRSGNCTGAAIEWTLRITTTKPIDVVSVTVGGR